MLGGQLVGMESGLSRPDRVLPTGAFRLRVQKFPLQGIQERVRRNELESISHSVKKFEVSNRLKRRTGEHHVSCCMCGRARCSLALGIEPLYREEAEFFGQRTRHDFSNADIEPLRNKSQRPHPLAVGLENASGLRAR